jgi:NADPH:quinone reductase
MRAWQVSALGGIDALQWRPDAPEPAAPAAGEVTVQMVAAALNWPDLLMLSGGYQFCPPLPYTPGMEGCGRIVATGQGVASDLLGRRVLVASRAGTLADLLTVPLAGVRGAPEALDDAQAAAFSVGALTAYVALADRGRAMAGERVLVTGAGGGMGLAAVAMARALGCSVVAVASSADKCAAAAAAGAGETHVIDRARPDFSTIAPVDMVFDPVAGALAAPALRALAWRGRYLIIGFAGGAPPRVALNRLLLAGIEAIGVRAGEAGRQDPAAGRRHLRAIDALAASGHLAPHIGLQLGIEDAPRGFAAMAAGALIGKVVLMF